MASLEDLNKQLTIIKSKIDEELNQLRFAEPIEFSLKNEADLIFKNKFNYSGLYLFEIRTSNEHKDFLPWFNQFIQRWRKDYESENTPNERKSRVNHHRNVSYKEWIPLYIGKSSHVGSRVHQHIHLEMKKATTALKLKSRKNLYEERFRVCTLRLPQENYSIISSRAEKLQRERLHPILGRQ